MHAKHRSKRSIIGCLEAGVLAFVCSACTREAESSRRTSYLAGLEESGFDRKQAYQDALQLKLEECDRVISQLQARASGLAAEARAGFAAVMEELKKHREALAAKVQEIQRATADTWDTLRADVQRRLDEFHKAHLQAQAQLTTTP